MAIAGSRGLTKHFYETKSSSAQSWNGNVGTVIVPVHSSGSPEVII